MLRIMRHEGLHRRDHGRDRAFHVGGATTIQHTVTLLGDKRVAVPLLVGTRRHHIGVAQQQQVRLWRFVAAAMRIQRIHHFVAAVVMRSKTAVGQPLGNQWLTTGICRRDRLPVDQLAGVIEGIWHGCLCAWLW